MAVAVVQVAQQVVQRKVRLVDADRLVEPDPPRHGQSQCQPPDNESGKDEKGGVAARVRLAPSREASTRSEELSLASTAEPPNQRSQ
jgi:hypothetical protein